MRTMYDALPGAFHGIPADAQMVAGYIDGGPGFPVMTDDLWALYPHAVHVRIATQAGTNDGHVLDVEAGDATPDQAPGWVKMRRAAGEHPSVYCSEAAWQPCRDAFAAQGVPEPEWWIASYSQPPDTSIPDGAVAHQWGGDMDGGYDASSVADHWPGVDDAGPTPGDDDMTKEEFQAYFLDDKPFGVSRIGAAVGGEVATAVEKYLFEDKPFGVTRFEAYLAAALKAAK